MAAVAISPLTAAKLNAELGRHDLDRERAAAPNDLHRRRLADQLAGHQPLEVVDLLDGDAVDLDDQVFRPQPSGFGGTPIDDLDDLDRRLTPEAGGDSGR